jgi:hypothetical protein
MRVSVINPTKKARKSKRKQSPKQKAASMRNLKKARSAKRKKAAPKSAPKAKKRRKSRKAKAKPKVGKKKRRKSRKAKVVAPKRRKSRKSKKRKAPKRKKARRAKMPRGKRVRPVMYKSKKRLVHSPRSRYAAKHYRFNPSLRGVSGLARRHTVKMANLRDVGAHPITVLVGAAGGFVTSGYVSGKFGLYAEGRLGKGLLADAVSLAGNYVGTEVPAMAVHWVLPKVGLGKHSPQICGGMRLGGYVAMGLNAVGIVARMVGVNLPYRELVPGLAESKDYILSGIGDMDLALMGLGQGGFVDTNDYAALDNESNSLDNEINALSAYIDPNNEWAGLSSDSGQGP